MFGEGEAQESDSHHKGNMDDPDNHGGKHDDSGDIENMEGADYQAEDGSQDSQVFFKSRILLHDGLL
jgi:hypothetical protein